MAKSLAYCAYMLGSYVTGVYDNPSRPRRSGSNKRLLHIFWQSGQMGEPLWLFSCPVPTGRCGVLWCALGEMLLVVSKERNWGDCGQRINCGVSEKRKGMSKQERQSVLKL